MTPEPATPPAWQYDETRTLATDFHDPAQVATYDERQHTAEEEERRLVRALGLTAEQTVLEYGPGTGAFARAAAEVASRVYAVDISRAMLDYARGRAEAAGLDNIEDHQGGFLSYVHAAPPVDVIVTKFALHHLPDFWKGVALERLHGYLKPGGRLVIHDVVYSFPPGEYREQLGGWIDEQTGQAASFSRADFEGHVRDEHSTYAWILRGLLERAGFRVDRLEVEGPTYAWFWCTRRDGRPRQEG